MENEFQEVGIEHCLDFVYNIYLVILENVVFLISKQPLQSLTFLLPSNDLNEVNVNLKYLIS